MIMGNKKDPFWRHIHLIYQQFMGKVCVGGLYDLFRCN